MSKGFRQICRRGDFFASHQARAIQEIINLDDQTDWLIQISKYRKKRSTEQNAFLHAVPLKMISDATGNDIEDLKTYYLGEAFGWQEYEVFGERRRKPMKRSSELNTAEFSYLMDYIEQRASQDLGMVIPKPNEYLLEGE